MTRGPGLERRLLTEAARDFAERRIAPETSGEQLTADAARRLVREAAGLGLPGLLIPESFGGSGGGYLDHAVATEELGAVDAGFAAGLSLTASVPDLVLAAGTDRQRRDWLPGVAEGTTILAGALNEPSVSGSELFDPAAEPGSRMRTRAERTGTSYVISGSKAQWVTNAGIADAYLVFARAEAGPTVFWVPADAPGLTVGPRSHLLGLRGGFHAELFLDEVRVPASARIGPEGEGLRLLMTTTPGMAVGLAAVFVGVARAAYEAALAHTGTRTSWGRPLREHQAVALALAEMAVELRTARLLVHDAAAALDAKADPSELALVVPAAKTRAVDAAISCAQHAVRLHGATGVTAGSAPERLLRDAWTGYACDFTREMLHLGIATTL
ncbi:acyl-CoA dehydrogenase family protein [Actinocorallia sp. A-T 12471]|uniref:acyl-CoA dehydrogenase family protein n=1 Tax=Actinocorallia sp. A-T 12471 TaxID=3089813 RepID=UPI0029CD2851|nr:acyl-CoA dehydrogenase family protein [Actinocorallia sp. A-T 12471]MDX6742409.1 acyl-CoA dehydrogenase family protein [Actinocorallia sp. A-T 12471]